VADYVASMEKIRLRDGIRLAMNVSSLGNKLFQVAPPPPTPPHPTPSHLQERIIQLVMLISRLGNKFFQVTPPPQTSNPLSFAGTGHQASHKCLQPGQQHLQVAYPSCPPSLPSLAVTNHPAGYAHFQAG